MESNVIKLAIVGDHSLFRKTLLNYLSQQSRIHIAVEVSDVFDLLNELKSDTADVLVTNLVMPGMRDIEMLRIIRNKYPDLKIVVLSMSADLRLINQHLDIGIHAYLSKADEPGDLLQAITAAAEDKIYRTRFLTEALYVNKHASLKNNNESTNLYLDEREKRILQMLWQEKSNKEIAGEIFLSVRSVEKIRQDMKQKMGVKSLTGLFKYALMNNLIGVNEGEIICWCKAEVAESEGEVIM